MTVYICGDSFAYPDPEYGPCWADLLAQRIHTVNLSRVCASNLQIALQVEHAISNSADYIIYLATSSTREDVVLKQNQTHSDLFSRFVNIAAPESGDLITYSQHSIDGSLLNSQQQSLLKQYHLEFSDLALSIYKNKLTIEATLNRLRHSGIPFLFDQGGFEHPSFAANVQQYFEEFAPWRSKINLWDAVANQRMQHRPYYHITDPDLHAAVCDYYYNEITKST